MAFKIVKTDDGKKTNWAYIRHVFYTGLIVWAVGVRLFNTDPFDDIIALKIGLGTLFDFLFLWALWMVVWYLAYPMRPRFKSTN